MNISEQLKEFKNPLLDRMSSTDRVEESPNESPSWLN